MKHVKDCACDTKGRDPDCYASPSERAKPAHERRYSRAEVEALLERQREACAAVMPSRGTWDELHRAVRATPLVEVKP